VQEPEDLGSKTSEDAVVFDEEWEVNVKKILSTLTPTLALAGSLGFGAAGISDSGRAGESPWGPEDEIGRLNLMTPESRAAILARVSGGRAYDLSVDYFIGMPSWQAAGDPQYRMWMTHTPHGTLIDDPLHLGRQMNERVSYSGAAMSMYTHMGTHIDG
jgi:hypothetical protein